VDNIDLDAAHARGITVTNTPDLVTNDTADLAMGLVLALMRRMVEGDLYVRLGKWRGGAMPLGAALSEKTIGIIGLGRIGNALARRADAFDMRVVWHGPREKPDAPYLHYKDLVEMAGVVDILAVTCPGGAETAGLVGADVLRALGPKGFLVNVARGSVVDEEALLIALENRAIAGAGLDVFADEPNVPEAFFGFDNVVLLPHVGTATLETRTKMGQCVVSNIMAYFEGRPVLTPLKKAGGVSS
ncbi:MAG: 2-hydroxyacid dehydrogenase, partial [Rhodospirillales bacterium]|nr:2-hydroxyacid dehydrogenase [Rhodospirillales bacterium]